MPVSDSQKKAEKKYKAKSYCSISLTMKKEKREEIRVAAAKAAEPVNTYIKKAIDMRMKSED